MQWIFSLHELIILLSNTIDLVVASLCLQESWLSDMRRLFIHNSMLCVLYYIICFVVNFSPPGRFSVREACTWWPYLRKPNTPTSAYSSRIITMPKSNSPHTATNRFGFSILYSSANTYNIHTAYTNTYLYFIYTKYYINLFKSNTMFLCLYVFLKFENGFTYFISLIPITFIHL